MDAFVKDRYRTWDSGIGKDIEKGKASFKQLEAHALKTASRSWKAVGRSSWRT